MAVSVESNRTTTRNEDPPVGFSPGSWRAVPTWFHALIILLTTAAALAIFELLWVQLALSVPSWQARAFELVVASLTAAFTGYFILRRQKAAEERDREDLPRTSKAEESVNQNREQLAGKGEEREVREDRQLLQAAIDALSAHIAILDDQGTIIAVNQAWRRFADENAAGDYGIGAKYLDSAGHTADHDAESAARGIGDVLGGQAEGFRLLYPCTCVDGQHWFQLRVSQFSENVAKRLLVSHEDVTEVKMAQEAQRDIDNRILQSREEERRRIARELHDSTVQKIFALNLNLMGLKPMISGGQKKVQSLLMETISLGRECMQELRTISYLLRPPLPAGHDFLPALYSYIDGFCKRSGIRVNLVLPSHAGRMPAKIENALFRVVQETLSNIHRHSQSATATVALRKDEESVVLEVKDKGRGMPDAPANGPYRTTGGGLAGIEERVHELGGSLEIKPANPGTIVTATIPLSELNVRRGVSA
jgi:signal transduction histidine kinase